VIGLGLLGGSVARAVKTYAPDATVSGFDADAAVRRARGRSRCAIRSPKARARRCATLSYCACRWAQWVLRARWRRTCRTARW
jgi:prephenate dehydrogenase